MKAVLTNFGTTGDVVPLLALAGELRRGGHETVLACPPSHRELVTRYGFDFAAAGPDLQDVQTAVNRRWIEDGVASTTYEEMAGLLAPLGRAIPETYDALYALARRADVLISGPAQPAARMVHETTGIPFASVQFSNFGGTGTPALQAATAALINPFRKRLGLRALANPVTRDANSSQLALYAMSRHLLPRPAAWPPHYQIAGFFFFEGSDWIPDAALRSLFDASEPPVIVSFGSMPHADPNRLADLIGEAASLAGVRVLLQQQSAGACASAAVDTVGFVPHDWLFPRGCCLVHHGGAGTAAAGFRAGKPTVYVPHGVIFDQTYWAQLSRDWGCSGDAIPFQTLTAPRLAASIRACLDDTGRQQRAARLGELVRQEHGVRTARRAIEELVRQVGLHEEAIPARPE